MVVLAAPPGPDGDRVRELAREALREVAVVTGSAGDDVLVYRQWSNLALTDLEHLAGVGQVAYRQMLAAPDFTPHARQDVAFDVPT